MCPESALRGGFGRLYSLVNLFKQLCCVLGVSRLYIFRLRVLHVYCPLASARLEERVTGGNSLKIIHSSGFFCVSPRSHPPYIHPFTLHPKTPKTGRALTTQNPKNKKKWCPRRPSVPWRTSTPACSLWCARGSSPSARRRPSARCVREVPSL